MSSRPAAGSCLDVALVLKRSVQVLGRDFPAIAVAGVLLVVLPGGFGRGFGDGDGLATLWVTLRGVGVMLFLALVSTGVVARLQGQALPTGAFLRRGLAAAQPGVQAGLIIAAAIFVGLIVQLFARHGTVAGWMLDVLLLALGLMGACVLLPVIPAAVMERLSPRAAFARAAVLTEGNRNRVLGIVLLMALPMAPLLALAGGGAGPVGAQVGPWALALVELAGYTLAAIVPAAVYAGLKEAA
jgi:hypothetical protein